MDGSDAAKRQKQISAQLETQGRLLSELTDKSLALEERLSPASRQQNPQTKAGGGPKEQEGLVPMAEELRGYNSVIRVVTDRLGGMIDRLEL